MKIQIVGNSTGQMTQFGQQINWERKRERGREGERERGRERDRNREKSSRLKEV